MKKKIGIGLVGFGTVGQAVAAILQEHALLESPLQLKKILVRSFSCVTTHPLYLQSPEKFSESFDELLKDPDIDVVIEVMGGTTTANAFIQEALKKGKHVVTANKDLLAQEGKQLLHLAEEQGCHLRFEASVGGALPIVQMLESSLSSVDIQSVAGIVNGTTNYILTRMEEAQLDFQSALQEAQNLGYAEQDPTNDIKGYDARYKLVVLLYLCTQTWFPLEQIMVEGIDSLKQADFEYAARMNRKIKLIAYLAKTPEGVTAFVLPLMVPIESATAKANGSTNIITVTSRYAQDLSLVGKGAGGFPTASAVIADLYHILKRPLSHPILLENNLSLIPFAECWFKHTLRFEVLDQAGIVGHIGTVLSTNGISIYALEQLPQYHHDAKNRRIVFTITLDPCKEGSLQQALEEINRASFMAESVYVLRELPPVDPS